jgi:HEAT repeat protein
MPEKPAAAIPPAFRKAPGDVSPETLAKVRDFLIALAGIAGGLKIYPPEHASIAAARTDAWSKLQAVLETQWELELTVEETSFQFAGETVYAEANLLKSLPYLMFKDGLRTLSFRRELTEPEFLELLGILRQVAILPPEDADIVALLWERDFKHISYLDSDDYLEAKIGAVERRSWDRPVDPAELAKGRIDLKPEDVAEIVKHSLETVTVGAKNEAKEGAVSAADADALARSEVGFLESAFGAERSIPAETSFLDIFSELLCMEDRPSALASMLQFADKHHQELLQRDDFAHAGLLLARLDELKSQGSKNAPIKVQDLERLGYRIKDSVSLAALKEEALRGRVDDAAAFFAYLERIGPRAVPLAADLFEEMEDGIFRSEAFVFLERVGRRSLDALAGLARDTMPFLSKGVANLLGRTKDRKAVPYLARFKDSKIKAVRLEAVKALLEIGDELALKIVKSFEADPDPEVREAARRGTEPGRAT